MIVVFGSGGQLGQELVALAKARGVPVRGFDHRQADIADAGDVLRALGESGATFAVNAAAYNKVDQAETDIAAATRINIDGPEVLAKATAQAGIPLVQISTDYVFAGDKAGASMEDDPIAPVNAYGRSKAEGDARVRTANARHYILRTAWVYGRYGANFLKLVLDLARTRDNLDIVADTRGSPTYSLDLARAILLTEAAYRRGVAPWGTYHVAGEGAASRYDQALAIVSAQARFTGRSPTVHPVSSASLAQPAPRPRNTELDSSKFARTFGFRPVPWRVGVDRAVAEIFEDAPPREDR